MNIRFSLLAIIFVLSIASCKNEASDKADGATTPATTQETAPPEPSFQTANPEGQPAGGGAATTTAPGMNPPHGQPGHRCDIAVGAPLDSKPTATSPTTTTTMPTMPSSPSAPSPNIQMKPSGGAPAAGGTTTTTAPGMNPPHGQPGHRCDIAVGAPLDSKPKQ